MGLLIAGFATSVGVIACRRPRTGSSRARVDALFAPWNRPDSPGCSVGVSRNGRVIDQRAYGMANLETATPITPETVFDAASVSKQFTAMSILLLAGRHQLALDDDVGKYIANWGDRGQRITIRHLLTHTSGLRDAFLLQGLAPVEADGLSANDTIVNILARARGLNFSPGAEFEYNNGAYTLLASLVQRVSGQSFAEFAEANIFRPLGMLHTHVHEDPTRIVLHRATGYSRAGNGFAIALRTYTDKVVGNAGLFTTTGDLLRWEANFAEVRVGDPALVAAMQTPVIATGWSERSGYGFGVEIAQDRGLNTVGHAGGDAGRRSYVVRYTDRNLAVAVLCNLDDVDPVTLSKALAEIYLDVAFPEPLPKKTVTPSPISLSAADLQNKVGLYRNLSDDSVSRVFLRDGRLMANENADDAGGIELKAVTADRFVVAGTPIVVEFARTAGGAREAHVIGATAKPMVAQLITTPFAPSSAELRAFEGSYASRELHGTYTIRAREPGLVLQVPTRSDIALRPVFTDAFGGSVVGVVKFARNARGIVTGFTVNAQGARRLPFERVE